MNQRDFIRITLMLTVLGLNAVFSHYASQAYRDTYHTIRAMRLGSCAVLVMAAVLVLQGFLCRVEKAQQHPRLSVQTVFTHVYGLGLAVFVSVYCLSSVSGDATGMYFIGATAVGCDDILERTKDATLRRAVMLCCVLLSGTALVGYSFLDPTMGESGYAFLSHTWLVAAFGAVLPLLSPFVILSMRGRRFYNPLTIYDFLHFAMPFAVFLSVQTLLFVDMIPEPQAESRRSLRNDTLHTQHATANATAPALDAARRLVSTFDVFAPLLSLNMLPTVFLAIQSTLLYSTVDFLAAFAAVTAFKSLVLHGGGALPVVIFVSASIAFSLRIYACFRDESDGCSVAYTRESEDNPDEDEMLRKLQQDIEISDV